VVLLNAWALCARFAVAPCAWCVLLFAPEVVPCTACVLLTAPAPCVLCKLPLAPVPYEPCVLLSVLFSRHVRNMFSAISIMIAVKGTTNTPRVYAVDRHWLHLNGAVKP
jgi:hypothetical protein